VRLIAIRADTSGGAGHPRHAPRFLIGGETATAVTEIDGAGRLKNLVAMELRN
jgi:hypothetical protein